MMIQSPKKNGLGHRRYPRIAQSRLQPGASCLASDYSKLLGALGLYEAKVPVKTYVSFSHQEFVKLVTITTCAHI